MLLLPKIFAVPLVLLLRPLLVAELLNILEAPLLALLAKEIMEALPPLPELLPAQLLPKAELPLLLADLAGSPLKLRILGLDAVLSNDDPLQISPKKLADPLLALSPKRFTRAVPQLLPPLAKIQGIWSERCWSPSTVAATGPKRQGLTATSLQVSNKPGAPCITHLAPARKANWKRLTRLAKALDCTCALGHSSNSDAIPV